MADSLSTEEQVVRYVGGSNYDAKNGRIDGSAFDRKPKDDDGLSFTRRYFINSDEEADRAQIRTIFASRMKVGSTAQFAQIEVGLALKNLAEFDEFFDFVEDRLEAHGDGLENPAHALLLGLPFVGEAVGSLKSETAGALLARCVNDVFSATGNS